MSYEANTALNFKNDIVSIIGQKPQLFCTNSGHYYIPLAIPGFKKDPSIVLISTKDIKNKSVGEKRKLTEKLHKQFNHQSYEKMSTLLKDAGVLDVKLIKQLQEITSNYDICLKYKRTPQKLIVGFFLAKHFKEMVSMDIKEIKGAKVLHLINHFTWYSVASIIKSK